MNQEMCPTTNNNLLEKYLKIFSSVQGYFTIDAALLFMAYNQLSMNEGVSGNTLEIGVHHGLSAMIVASLRGDQRKFVAVDLFEDMQEENTSCSGGGSKEAFFRNMAALYGDLDFLKIITDSSTRLGPGDLGGEFSFCHIDGGHSPEETYNDLRLCSDILLPGGLLALDDYFNPDYPGVVEGAVKFMLENRGVLQPLAIGFNKVLFQRTPVQTDLNRRFDVVFPLVPKAESNLWGRRVNHFKIGLKPFFDLKTSAPQTLAPHSRAVNLAAIEPQSYALEAAPGQQLTLRVRVKNKSNEPFPYGKDIFGLSYHLLAGNGTVLKHDNERAYLIDELPPEGETSVELMIKSPNEAGVYLLEVDLVWEHMMWFKDKGNPTSIVKLQVR